MNNIKKTTMLFLSILFAAFLAFTFDSASSLKAAECNGSATTEGICVVVNESRYLKIADKDGRETTYINVFADMKNVKLSFFSYSSTKVSNVRYRLTYSLDGTKYYSKFSDYVEISSNRKDVILNANDIFSQNSAIKDVKLNKFDEIGVQIQFTAGWLALYAVKATYEYVATYKPLTVEDVSLYTESDTTSYTYKVSNVVPIEKGEDGKIKYGESVYGEKIESNNTVTVSLHRLLQSGATTLIRSPYVVTLSDYQTVIPIPKFDGEFIIRVSIDTINGTVDVERTVSCDMTPPRVIINDVTAKVAGDQVKINAAGVSNIRVFNITSDGASQTFYKILAASLPQPSVTNLTTDWIEYVELKSGALGNIVVDGELSGKYYLYVVAKDLSDNYSQVVRSDLFTLDNTVPYVEKVNATLDSVNSEIIVSVHATDVSTIASYMARVGYYADGAETPEYMEWQKFNKYSFRLPINQVPAGSSIFVEVYGIDALDNYNENASKVSDFVKIESYSMSVAYENVTSEHLREHGSLFFDEVVVRITGSDIASINVNGAEFKNNPQICTYENYTYRCKFTIDGEYSLVVKNMDGSETISRTFIINTHGGILVDSIKVTDYKKYFMASVTTQGKSKFTVSIPYSAYNVEDTIKFIYVAPNGAYKHVIVDEVAYEVDFKDYSLSPYDEYLNINVPLTVEQYTGLKYSSAMNTNYILCYTVETEEVGTLPEAPEVETPNNPEVDEPTVEQPETPENNEPEKEESSQTPVTKNEKKSSGKISNTDMLKLFIAFASVILFFKIVNYRKGVKMI